MDSFNVKTYGGMVSNFKLAICSKANMKYFLGLQKVGAFPIPTLLQRVDNPGFLDNGREKAVILKKSDKIAWFHTFPMEWVLGITALYSGALPPKC